MLVFKNINFGLIFDHLQTSKLRDNICLRRGLAELVLLFNNLHTFLVKIQNQNSKSEFLFKLALAFSLFLEESHNRKSKS